MFGRRRRDAAPSGPDGIFGVLRGQVLDLDPASVDLAPTADFPRVFGVVMDTAYPEATATLVALADGTTSLYLSTGAASSAAAATKLWSASRAGCWETHGLTALGLAQQNGHDRTAAVLIAAGAN